MIKEFIDAWNKNNSLLLEDFKKEIPVDYKEILCRLIEVVINPYIKELSDYPMHKGIDIQDITVIDNGDYQGTLLFIMPFDCCQPEPNDYIFTAVNYGSCSGCDTFQSIESSYHLYAYDENERDIEGAAKDFQTLALHLLQHFKYISERNEK